MPKDFQGLCANVEKTAGLNLTNQILDLVRLEIVRALADPVAYSRAVEYIEKEDVPMFSTFAGYEAAEACQMQAAE